jgi:hypothetical protein
LPKYRYREAVVSVEESGINIKSLDDSRLYLWNSLLKHDGENLRVFLKSDVCTYRMIALRDFFVKLAKKAKGSDGYVVFSKDRVSVLLGEELVDEYMSVHDVNIDRNSEQMEMKVMLTGDPSRFFSYWKAVGSCECKLTSPSENVVEFNMIQVCKRSLRLYLSCQINEFRPLNICLGREMLDNLKCLRKDGATFTISTDNNGIHTKITFDNYYSTINYSTVSM